MSEYIKRISEKTGFIREKYIDKSVDPDKIIAIPFFGDSKSEFILSTLLLHKIKNNYPENYFILCSWPNHSGLYPYIDEYWTIEDSQCRMPSKLAIGFDNEDKQIANIEKQLIKYFNVFNTDQLKKYYNQGITSKFFEDFKTIDYHLPTLAGLKSDLSKDFSKRVGYKIFIHPTRMAKGWHQGQVINEEIPIFLWKEIISKLLENGYVPVVWQDWSTYDLSPHFAAESVFLYNMKMLDILGVMRGCDCVVDVFSGLSKTALIARSPYLEVTERNVYINDKNYELNDLCSSQIPHKRIFSFANTLSGSDAVTLADMINAKLNEFVPVLDELPSTIETKVQLSYSVVKEHKNKRFGVKFIKLKK